MSTKLVLTCHDCENELIIYDIHGDLSKEDIQHCPVCGSTDNIDVVPKSNKNDG